MYANKRAKRKLYIKLAFVINLIHDLHINDLSPIDIIAEQLVHYLYMILQNT